MPVKRSFIPNCNFGEKVNVSIATYENGDRNFSFDFPVKITEESTTGNRCDIWIDASGSLSFEQQFEAERAARNSFQNPIFEDSERWLKWFAVSIADESSALAYINESSNYTNNKSLFREDLILLNQALRDSKVPIQAKLLIINDNSESSGLIKQFERANLINSDYNIDYDIISKPDATQITKFIESSKNIVEIRSLPSFGENLIRYFKGLGLLKVSDILESLFTKRIVRVKSQRLIVVKAWCGDDDCPSGCCKVCSPNYPYYCCVKF